MQLGINYRVRYWVLRTWAFKESLENLLGSFTIFLDKPFTVGDIVTVGTVTGTIEKVGFK